MCTFLSQQTLTVGLGRRLGLLVEQKRLEPLLPALRAFDPRITAVCIGADSQVLVDVGLDSLLPLELMGDGVVKALALLASVVEAKNGVVVVDELDNGLHHAPLAELWKAIFVACKECNTQLVATTHSYECVEAFSQIYGETEPDGDDIRLYRIDKDVGHHELVMYTAPLLRLGMEKAFEVR